MLHHQAYGNQFNTMSPSFPADAKYTTISASDLAARQQTFASDGDAIFLPKHEGRSYESASLFLAPPAAPQANPFFSSQQQQQMRGVHVNNMANNVNVPHSLTPSPGPGPHNPNNSQVLHHLLSSQSFSVPLQRTGNLVTNNDTRNSHTSGGSPGSIESSVLTNQSTFYQQEPSSIANKTNLPLIPDIRKVRGSIAKHLARNDHHCAQKLIFVSHVPAARMCKNPKSGHMDISMTIVIRTSSTNNDSNSSHTVYKWYSDLISMHERLGINQYK